MERALQILQRTWRFISNVILCLGGHDPKIVDQMPLHHRFKPYSYGLSMLVSGALAWFGGAHTALTYTGSYLLAIFFGFIWSGIILVFDFSIIVNLSKENRFWVAPIRIISSFIFSLLISLPLILMIYSDSISQIINQEQATQVNQEQERFQQKMGETVDQPLEKAKQEMRESRSEYLGELDGKRGTGKWGVGPVAQAKGNAYDEARKDLDRYAQKLELQKKELIADHARRISQIKVSHDEIAELQALFKLSKDPGVLTRWVMLTLGLVLLEMGPLLLKLCARPGAYQVEVGCLDEERQRVHDEESNTQKMQHDLDTTICNLDIAAKKDQKQLENERAETFRLMTEIKNTVLDAAQVKTELLDHPGVDPSNEAFILIEQIANNRIGEIVVRMKKPNESAPFEKISPTYKILLSNSDTQENPFVLTNEMYKLASKLQSQSSSQKVQLQALCDWMKSNLVYDHHHNEYSGGIRGAEDVFSQKMFSPAESSAFTIALARAMGFEAHYVAISRNEQGEAVNHAAAKVVLNDKSEFILDLSRQDFDAKPLVADRLSDDEVTHRFRAWRSRKAA